MGSIGRYSKFIVALIGVATVVITNYYASAAWAPAAVQALAALGVLLVPNQQAAPAPVAAPAPAKEG